MSSPKTAYNIYLSALSDHYKQEAAYVSALAKYNQGEISIEDLSIATSRSKEASELYLQAKENWRASQIQGEKKSHSNKQNTSESHASSEITTTDNRSIRILSNDSVTERTWNFRDDNNQHFFGDIPNKKTVITLTLNWK